MFTIEFAIMNFQLTKMTTKIFIEYVAARTQHNSYYTRYSDYTDSDGVVTFDNFRQHGDYTFVQLLFMFYAGPWTWERTKNIWIYHKIQLNK